MDDLVLLAQMHGSGPDTVRALKEKGIHTARDLAGLDPVELERLAGLKPSSARKMVAAAIRMASGSGDSPAGFSREQREQEMAAGETVSAGSPPAITDRAKARRKLETVEAEAREGAVRQAARQPPEGKATDPDEGVNPEEASLLAHRPGRAIPPATAPDPSNWLPSFWRFG
ncbi:MAG: hypothetical protein DMF49_13320 [Acidobacteria bacterium]|nr:MAG: hypothetical protein DMF49_13320 [Acidobacteriota bacterium]